MSGEILETTPLSGEYPEFHFGEHFAHKLWVQFEDKNFQKWNGCFPSESQQALNKILVNKSNDTAFVISGGAGFLIDINKKSLLFQTKEHTLIESAILTENPNYFIAGTFYSIYVFDNETLVKEIRPEIIVDGIYLKCQKDKMAIGELATAENQYKENLNFTLDLETFELALNKKVRRKSFRFFEWIKVVDKKEESRPGILQRIFNKPR